MEGLSSDSSVVHKVQGESSVFIFDHSERLSVAAGVMSRRRLGALLNTPVARRIHGVLIHAGAAQLSRTQPTEPRNWAVPMTGTFQYPIWIHNTARTVRERPRILTALAV
jgi:hypothetical protein